MNIRSEMFEKCKLARLVRGFEYCNVKSECLGETIREGAVQLSLGVERPHSTRALTGLDDELDSPGVKPAMPSRDSFLKRFLGEGSLVLLAHLVLDGKSSLIRELYNCPRLEWQLGEALTAFDSCDTEVCAQVEISLKLPLGNGPLERPSASHCGHVMGPRRRYLAPGRSLVGNLPACHRDLQGRHEVRALVKMAFECQRIVAWIEGARQGWQFRNTNRS